jgi:hypothetical protein
LVRSRSQKQINMKDYELLINEQCSIIHEEKNLLSDTDYQVLREIEGGTPISATLSARRALARARINDAEVEIERLKSEQMEEQQLIIER